MIKDIVGRDIQPGDYVAQRYLHAPEKGALTRNTLQIGRVDSLGRVRARVIFPEWPDVKTSVAGSCLVIVRFLDGQWTADFDPKEPAPPLPHELSYRDEYKGPETNQFYDPEKATRERTPVTVLLDAMIERDKAQLALATPMQHNDAGVTTVKDYLIALLAKLWECGDDFSSERPFGNPAWEFDLFEALVHAGLISGVIEDGNYLGEFDREAGEELITLAIKALGEK